MNAGGLLHVVGARPQFVKLAALLRAAGTPERHRILHTGQHYDAGLSQVFFDELGIAPPDAHLGIGGGTHGAQTGQMLAAIEAVLEAAPPEKVVVYGDTNSTLAGALAAAKLGIPVVHVEAGLRSFDRGMPEEINRVVTDHVSDLLLCPTEQAAEQLAREGIVRGVHVVGDVMLDIALREAPRVRTTPLGRFLQGETAALPAAFSAAPPVPDGYAVATIHRAANTDAPEVLRRLVTALGALGMRVYWPVHPRTRRAMARASIAPPASVVLLEPLGYLDFAALLSGARAVLTDSGGVQKEAYFAGKQCFTLRDTTEWRETLGGGWNTLVGADPAALVAAFARPAPSSPVALDLFGGGHAAARCVALIEAPGAP
jgi:UDP-N-acetylglucosamine 2-epimerase